jgi:hypothetical protein
MRAFLFAAALAAVNLPIAPGFSEDKAPTAPAGAAVAQAESATPSGSSAPGPYRGSGKRAAAWITFGTGAALIASGVILAFSAEAVERDVADLLRGDPPAAFDGTTRDRYNDLQAQGERYQRLSWLSFGLAGVAGIAGAVLMLWPDGEAGPTSSAWHLRPQLGPDSAAITGVIDF